MADGAGGNSAHGSGELDIDEVLRGIDAAFQSLSGAVKTLMLTGVNYMRTKAQLKQFAEQGIEKYWIETTRDERTCTKCLDMHSKQFWVENAKIGENAPPLHPFCRCWIAPVLGQGADDAERTVKLYRVMSEAEYDSTIKNRGNFSRYDYAMEGKWFATSPEGAERWGNAFYPDGIYKLIEIEVPSDALGVMYYVENLDGFGPAYFAEIDVINSIMKGLRLQ